MRLRYLVIYSSLTTLLSSSISNSNIPENYLEQQLEKSEVYCEDHSEINSKTRFMSGPIRTDFSRGNVNYALAQKIRDLAGYIFYTRPKEGVKYIDGSNFGQPQAVCAQLIIDGVYYTIVSTNRNQEGGSTSQDQIQLIKTSSDKSSDVKNLSWGDYGLTGNVSFCQIDFTNGKSFIAFDEERHKEAFTEFQKELEHDVKLLLDFYKISK